MKFMFNTILVILMLFITGCDSESDGGYTDTPPDPVEVVQMTIATPTRDFDQDTFISALATELGIDVSRIYRIRRIK